MTTGPSTGVEVSVPGRQDMFLKTRELPSCLAGAPTSVWHRSWPSCLWHTISFFHGNVILRKAAGAASFSFKSKKRWH